MSLTAGEKIKVILKRRNKTITDLAAAIGTTRQNMSNKFSRDNFNEKELNDIAEALDCDFDMAFILRDTQERI